MNSFKSYGYTLNITWILIYLCLYIGICHAFDLSPICPRQISTKKAVLLARFNDNRSFLISKKRVLLLSLAQQDKSINISDDSAKPTRSTLKIPRSPKWNWPFWFVLPIAPYNNRQTIMEEVVSEQIWTFDQLQGVLYVNVPIRMTIVRLNEGLLVYAPVAPTLECVNMVKGLEKKFGPVKHIILPTLAIEHKVFAGPFSRKFPQAQSWVMPGQYAFPFNLPLGFLGFGAKKVKELPPDSNGAPWEQEMDHILLGPLRSKDGIGAFGEATFFHKYTSTLLVTDIVVQVSEKIPKIVENSDPRALLFHARDNALQDVVDSKETRLRGWRRIQQFGLFFQPSALKVLPLKDAVFNDAPKSPMKELGWGGIFPFAWGSLKDENNSFGALQGGLLVAPILQTLILNRAPRTVLEYADQVAQWPIKRLITCHLGNDVLIKGSDFRAAFQFLEQGYFQPTRSKLTRSDTASFLDKLLSPFIGEKPANRLAAPLEEDLRFLRETESRLVELGTIDASEPPLKVKRR